MRREERLDDFQLSLREAMEDASAGIWTSLPALVTSVDLPAQTISAQPAIRAVQRDTQDNKTNVILPLLINVPIVWPRGGGFSLTFPLKVGDEVLVIFADRCIDTWWQSGGVGVQAEERMHDLSDGFAILAPTSQPKKLESVSSDSVQLRNEIGDNFIEIKEDGSITVKSGQSKIDIDEVGKITLDSLTGIEINTNKLLLNGGEMKIVADSLEIEVPEMKVSGDNFSVEETQKISFTAPVIEVNGPIQSSGGITIDGQDYTVHQHSGVVSGTDITGPVVP